MERPRILIVDDSTMARRELRKLLDHMCDLVEADHGAAGLACARTQRFDLVIVDLHMPVMGGIEFVRLVRGLPGYAEVPLFAVTTESNDEVMTRARAAGVDVWVHKPLQAAPLVRAVEQALVSGVRSSARVAP